MIIKKLKDFNIRQIADSGQCFRMIPYNPDVPETAFRVISGEHFLLLEQHDDTVTFHCPDSEFPFWERYFDLDTDYDTYIRSIDPKDDYLTHAAAFGNGIRILNQDLWEMIITFIISQQKTIPAIRSLVETLSMKYGTAHSLDEKSLPDFDFHSENFRSAKNESEAVFYSFPTPEELNRASLDDLLTLKLGYRAKYIKRTCEDVCSGKLDFDRLRSMNYEAAMQTLLSCYGIGIKVANCICLFGLHQIGAFPVDTWIKKILLREYAPKSHCMGHVPESRLYGALIEENFSKYPGYAGVLQQYIFYYERVGSGNTNPSATQYKDFSPRNI